MSHQRAVTVAPILPSSLPWLLVPALWSEKVRERYADVTQSWGRSVEIGGKCKDGFVRPVGCHPRATSRGLSDGREGSPEMGHYPGRRHRNVPAQRLAGIHSFQDDLRPSLGQQRRVGLSAAGQINRARAPVSARATPGGVIHTMARRHPGRAFRPQVHARRRFRPRAEPVADRRDTPPRSRSGPPRSWGSPSCWARRLRATGRRRR